MPYIPYGRQEILEQDLDAVKETLCSDWLTQGPLVTQFEEAMASYCGAAHAIAVSNGTAALHLACLALGVAKGDIVWTTPNTFVASANCALYCNATVDFVDICPDTYNMSVAQLEQKLIVAKKNGVLPKVVIPVHFAGQSCDMARIRQLADQYGFFVIEDASHAVGGRYQGSHIGSCEYADITTFSFHPVKIITTGEGGMCLTNDDQLNQKLQLFRTHGVTRDPSLMTSSSDGDWYYQQVALGYNYRITDMQCALGLTQLNRLDTYVEKRNALADRYQERLSHLPLILPTVVEGNYSAYHLYVVQVADQCSKTRKQVFDDLRRHGIGVNVHYIPVHTQPFYQSMGFSQGDFPEAECYYDHAISLPMFPTLSDADFEKVVQVLEEAMT